MWILYAVFPDEESSDLVAAKLFYPHVVAVMGLFVNCSEDRWQSVCAFQPVFCVKEWALLLSRLSWYLERDGRPMLAVCTARKAESVLSRLYAESSNSLRAEDWIESMINLAKRLCRNEHITEAEEFARKALDLADRMLPEGDEWNWICLKELEAICKKRRYNEHSRYRPQDPNVWSEEFDQTSYYSQGESLSLTAIPQAARHRASNWQAPSGYRDVSSVSYHTVETDTRTQTSPLHHLSSYKSLHRLDPRDYVRILERDGEYYQHERMSYQRTASTESKPVVMLAVVTGELCCSRFTDWWWYKLNP
jgi:hypothetical protein